MCAFRHISDEQQRSLPEFARPKGSEKMADFFVAPPQCSVKLQFRCCASKSSHFFASQADSCSNPTPLLYQFILLLKPYLRNVLIKDVNSNLLKFLLIIFVKKVEFLI